MGFRADVDNFQPYYRFKPIEKHLASLRIGASVLREYVEQDSIKEEEKTRKKETVKDVLAKQRENVRPRSTLRLRQILRFVFIGPISIRRR